MRARALLLLAVLACPALGTAAPPADERPAPARLRVPGKPTGPIAVEYTLAGAPAVGVPLEIAVKARVEADVKGLAIEANPSAPRAVLVTPPELVTAADGVYSWTITVVPLAVEAGYLSVIVAGRVDGVAQARGVTVSLHGAAVQGAAPSAGPADPEALIALPVEETP
ncbi:MAG TPA: hypothetical protein VFL84_12085 [Gammaproteobacteria bacterium]|nr:hypothetical protein [Gammaproteobacteria bacterium]